jgi:ribonuclease HI
MKSGQATAIRKSVQAEPIVIYTDGSGARPDGKGSGIAWLRNDTSEKHVEMIEGLTNNQAEYKAIYSALLAVPERSVVEIRSDSQLAVYQLSGLHAVWNPDLASLLGLIKGLIVKRKLTVTFRWIPRSNNRAGKLLQHQKPKPSMPASSPEQRVEPRKKTRP